MGKNYLFPQLANAFLPSSVWRSSIVKFCVSEDWKIQPSATFYPKAGNEQPGNSFCSRAFSGYRCCTKNHHKNHSQSVVSWNMFLYYPKNHWPLLWRGLTLFSAGFWDLQTTSFEIPWFLGYFFSLSPPNYRGKMNQFDQYDMFPMGGSRTSSTSSARFFCPSQQFKRFLTTSWLKFPLRIHGTIVYFPTWKP